MLELVFKIFTGLASPYTLLIGFFVSSIFQLLLSQRLRHKYPWFAFLPLLKTIQIFQMGKVSAWNIFWILLPVVGLFLYIYKLIKALVCVCERAGERASFTIILLIPYVRIIGLARLAFKTGFWVKTGLEKELIEKTIKGLVSGYDMAALKDFAVKQNIGADDFDTAADKALTVKTGHLNLSDKKYALPVGINILVLGLYVAFGSAIFMYGVAVGVKGLFQALVGGVKAEIVEVKKPDSSEEKSLAEVSRFWIEPGMKSVQTSGEEVLITFSGSIYKGELREGEAVAFLSSYLEPIDVLKVESIKLKDKKMVEEPESVETAAANDYVGITFKTTLKNKDALYEARYLVISNPEVNLKAEADRGLSDSRKDTLLKAVSSGSSGGPRVANFSVEVKLEALTEGDNLFVFDKNGKLVNAAKIIELKSIDRNYKKQPATTIAAGKRASLKVELARDYSSFTHKYLSTAEDIKSLIK